MCCISALTSERLVSLVPLAERVDLDEVVEHRTDLLLVGDELVAEDHLVHVVVEASDLWQRI